MQAENLHSLSDYGNIGDLFFFEEKGLEYVFNRCNEKII